MTPTGRSFEHCRQWLIDCIKKVSSVFAIDVCSYAMALIEKIKLIISKYLIIKLFSSYTNVLRFNRLGLLGK